MKNIKHFFIPAALLLAFVLWTLAVSCYDVSPIGPSGSSVGFSHFNSMFHSMTKTNMTLYILTDWLSIIPIALVLCFAILGLCQLIKRKSLMAVDFDILALGAFYAVVLAAFLFFEICVVNYRPILIDGKLEASYPSSTTMLVLCIMPTALIQLRRRIKISVLKNIFTITCCAYSAFMVTARTISGVHWITDIIGGALLSAGLVMLYYSIINMKNPRLQGGD